jgi:hypothetical protein
MSQHRKHRGYRSQKVVADRLRPAFPHAEPTGAGRQGSDILGTVGIDWEIAARRGFPVVEKMRQLAERRPTGTLGIVVLRPDGMGETTVGDWPAIVTLDTMVWLLREAGYGEPNP